MDYLKSGCRIKTLHLVYLYYKFLKMPFSKNIKISFFFVMLSCHKVSAQNPVNWTNDQLIQPSQLAAAIKSGKDIPVLFSIGPEALIPHSNNIGMVKDPDNIKKFKAQLSQLPKDTKIVEYCGCCPYEHCPNVRPAIDILKEMKFTNYYLLDLPHNIKKDWIDKGYPTHD